MIGVRRPSILQETPNASRRPVRSWPAVAIALLLAAALVWIWTSFGVQRQSRILATIASVGLAAILGFAWLVVFSRLSLAVRAAIAVAAVALVALGWATLERRGVSGDVLPLFGWRWSKDEPGPAVPEIGHEGATRRAESQGSSGEWPQFLGPDRDAALPLARLATDWQKHPPRELWRRPVGRAWSGFAVAGPFAVTQEQRDDEELVTCYDRETGKLIWAHAEAARHEDPLGGPGPRATPAIHDGLVLALGGTGILSALDLETGRRRWSVDVMGDNGVKPPQYGVAASPLVVGRRVVVAGGGPPGGCSLAAYDLEDGRRAWRGGDDPAAYSSPVLARLAGREQIVMLNERSLAAHDPTDGAVLWRHAWPPETEKVAQPVIVAPDRVFVSTGYGVGGKMFRVVQDAQGPAVELLWESVSLKAKLSNVVQREGHLYGLDDGILVCLDAADGRRSWKAGRYGHGQLLLAGAILLIQSEAGDVVLVEATPEAHRELARLRALSDKTWNHPALAGRHLLVRNDREAACYELPLE